jgi:hypothetical protein
MKKLAVLLTLTLIVSPIGVFAFDYNAWIPNLPKKLGNMLPTGTPDGMNMDSGGQKWSSLNQEYKSQDGKKTANLAVIAGKMAPQVMGFQSMLAMNMNMETNDQVIKTVTVSGKKAVVVLDKQEKSGTLTIPVKPDTILALTLDPASSTNELITMAQSIPIAVFAK